MAQAAESPLVFGDPAGAGTISIEIGGAKAEFHFPLTCPGQRKHERRHHVKKNGHDNSVKGSPQQHHCNTCKSNFYTHTSGYYHGLFKKLKVTLKQALKGGRLDLQQLIAKFDLSPSAASRLLAALLRKVEALGELKRYKEFQRGGKVIFSDETFLKIQGKQYYIVVLRNEQGKVLDAFLTRHRSMDVLLPHFRKAMKRMARGVALIVTDDFTAYQSLVFELGVDIIHVRCIHKPPYGRVIVDAIEWEGNVAHYTTAATTSDVLKKEGTFLSRVTKHDKKKKIPGAKRGPRKGSKRRPKAVVAAEKAAKASEKAALAAEGQVIPKKRGRKNYTKEGEVHVFHYHPKLKVVKPCGGSDDGAAKAFTQLVAVFAGKCITTNTMEEFFSAMKRLLHFSGWRTPEHWALLIDLYVVLRQEKSAVAHLVDELEFRPHLLRKNMNKFITVKISKSAPQQGI